AGGVGRAQTGRGGAADPDDLGRLEGPALEPRVEVLALQELHREVEPASGRLAEAEHVHDVRVPERHDGARLAREAPARALVAGFPVEDLQGDRGLDLAE